MDYNQRKKLNVLQLYLIINPSLVRLNANLSRKMKMYEKFMKNILKRIGTYMPSNTAIGHKD